MAEPASTLAAGSVGSAGTAGSVGTVETQYLDLPEPVRLDCGRELHPVRVAYETYGALSPRRDNVILVCHALSGDAHAAGFAKTPPEESTRDGFGAEDRDGAVDACLSGNVAQPERQSLLERVVQRQIAAPVRLAGSGKASHRGEEAVRGVDSHGDVVDHL